MSDQYLMIGAISALAVVVLVGAFIAWRLIASSQKKKREAEYFDAMMCVLPDFELDLERSNGSEWSHKNNLETDEEKLEANGLVHCGYFAQHNAFSIHHRSVWQFQESVVVVLNCQAPNLDNEYVDPRYWVEVYAQSADGGSVCVCNAKINNKYPRPEEHSLTKHSSRDVLKLVRMIKDSVPEGAKLVAVNDPVSFYCSVYERVSEYIWSDSALKSDTFEDAMYMIGVEFNDNLIEKLQEYASTSMPTVYSSRILKRLSKSPKISKDQWNGISDRLVVVHEKMRAEDVSDVLYQLVTNLSEDQEELIDEMIKSGDMEDPIESFGELMHSLKPGAKRIAKMQKPVVGEVYLSD